jgi:hypothetical protein
MKCSAARLSDTSLFTDSVWSSTQVDAAYRIVLMIGVE